MSKSYYSLGLMSGTSMDGVDASLIQTDGKSSYKPILDKYFEYPQAIYKQLTKLRDKIKLLSLIAILTLPLTLATLSPSTT